MQCGGPGLGMLWDIGHRSETLLFHADALKWSLLSAVVGWISLNISENYL